MSPPPALWAIPVPGPDPIWSFHTDLGIIKTCGIGVAMGNAPDFVKEAADYVTDLNTADGLAKALRKYVL